MEMAKIGPGIAGGNNRQTLTDEDAIDRPRPVPIAGAKMTGCTMGLDEDRQHVRPARGHGPGRAACL